MSGIESIRIPLPAHAPAPGDVHAEQMPDPSSTARRRAATYRPQLIEAMNELHAAAVRLGHLDPTTTELVRLRCATWHNCRVCGSLRHMSGGAPVVDESLAAKVADYERSDLDERHKVALRLADAYMMVPGRIDADLRADARQHFTEAELTELFFDIIAWTQQKPLVSLALDIPPATDRLTGLEFDEAGHPVLGAALS